MYTPSTTGNAELTKYLLLPIGRGTHTELKINSICLIFGQVFFLSFQSKTINLSQIITRFNFMYFDIRSEKTLIICEPNYNKAI